MPDDKDGSVLANAGASAADVAEAVAAQQPVFPSAHWGRVHSALRGFPVATTVAVSAFVFSLGNAFFAYCEAEERRDFEARQEVRSGIEALAVAEARYQEATVLCQQQNQCSAQDFEQQNYDAKVERAIELVNEADVNSAELRAVARSVAGTQRYEISLALYERAISISPDEYERTQSVIGASTVLFEKDPADARKLLADQTKRLERAQFESGVERLNLLWRVDSFWVSQEAFNKDCKRLGERISEATSVLGRVPAQYYGGFFPTPEQWNTTATVYRQAAGCS